MAGRKHFCKAAQHGVLYPIRETIGDLAETLGIFSKTVEIHGVCLPGEVRNACGTEREGATNSNLPASERHISQERTQRR